MSIKRYTMYPDCMVDCYIAHEEDDSGAWVKHIEHERAIAEKDAEIARLRKVVEAAQEALATLWFIKTTHPEFEAL